MERTLLAFATTENCCNTTILLIHCHQPLSPLHPTPRTSQQHYSVQASTTSINHYALCVSEQCELNDPTTLLKKLLKTWSLYGW